MSRILGLVLALALTAGGALWLVFILALAEHVSNRLIAAASSSLQWACTGYGSITSIPRRVRMNEVLGDSRFWLPSPIIPTMSSLSSRTRSGPAGFIEPCLPSPADKPPSGANWIHEIKHDGYRLMARRDPVGIRLLTRRGNDWANRFPLVVEAVNHLKVRSCLIDGEVVCCDERGVAVFHVLRHRRNEQKAFLYAFDLLELDGADMRREPIEVRKATLASILRKSRDGCASTSIWSTRRVMSCSATPARWGWRGSSRSA